MSVVSRAAAAPAAPIGNPLTDGRAAAPISHEVRIPGSFQLMLALYVILTGTFATVIQSLLFGIQGGGGTSFAAAMLSGIAFDFLLLLPILLLANHPLGVLHPLLLAVVVWPLVVHMPGVIQDWGGWAGIFAGAPVEPPRFVGIPSRTASTIWLAIAKFNAVQVISLLSVYAGFWAYKGRALSRPLVATLDPKAVRGIMLRLSVASLFVLLAYVSARGGVGTHLASMGEGRFVALSGDGPILVLTDLGSIAVWIWIAARPGDIKSPVFLGLVAAISAGQFVSDGSRGSAMLVPLTVGLIWALKRQKIPWKIALILVPFLFVSFGLLGAVRTSSWAGSTAGQVFATTGWAESAARAQKEIAGRRAFSASVPVVDRGFAVSGGPLWGKSYVVAVTSFVPRAIWEDKPRAVGSIYARTFLRANFSGTTIPVAPQAEMYWNFGLPGVVVLSVLFGVLLRAVFQFYWPRRGNPFVTMFYVLFITSFHISSDRISTFEQKTGLILLCYVLVMMFSPRSKHAGDFTRQRLQAQPHPALTKRER